MATGLVTDADSNDDPCIVVQQLGEERGQGIIAIRSFAKGQTIFREKVQNTMRIFKITHLL